MSSATATASAATNNAVATTKEAPKKESGRTSRSKGEDTNPDYALPGIGNYLFHKTVGEGNFAKVKLAKHKLTGQEVAIKVIDKTQLDDKKLSKLYREVRIMKLLHHPHIVRLYEVIETKSTVFLVMEYASGGELYDYLVVHGRMKEKEARAKFRQILSAVSYCHKKRVIHRDLKAENLLLDANLDIKIADFGFSNYYDPDGKLDTFCGSPPYAAPELFQGRRYTGPEVDVWSLGVILYVLTTGCLPFDGKNLQEMRESVCRGKYRIPFYLSDGCEKLLRKFLVRDPLKRSQLDIVIDDSWINEGYTESPITSELGTKVGEDEAVIRVMETKFKVDRETILKSLRDNVYDDVAAIYHLLYHERDLKGEHGEIRKMDSPVRATPTATADTANKVANMGRIDEDSAAQHTTPRASASPTTGSNNSNDKRRRRFTVGGEADVQKMADSEDGQQVVDQLQKLRINDEGNNSQLDAASATHGNNASSTANPAHHLNLPTTGRGAQPAIIDTDDALVIVDDDNPSTQEPSQSSGAPPSAGRKRHNTIVGVFRSAIRRQSDGASSNNSAADNNGTDADGKPRSLRFTFNSNTTSSKPADDIVMEVMASCARLHVKARLVGRYLVECLFAADTIKFEIEVCKLPRLKNLHGLRFKRLSGPSSEYKDICEKILGDVAL